MNEFDVELSDGETISPEMFEELSNGKEESEEQHEQQPTN